MKDIYVTGGIGSGKTTLTQIFMKRGYTVISADVISNSILQLHQKEIGDIASIRCTDYSKFKSELALFFFTDESIKKDVEDFMLPKIWNEIDRLIEICRLNNLNFIVEAPTYFESRKMVKDNNHFIILVTAPRFLKIDRITKRNGITRETAEIRIDSQLDDELKKPLCDYIISNIDEQYFTNWVNDCIDYIDELRIKENNGKI